MHAIVKHVFGFGCFGTLVYCSMQEVQTHVQPGASTSARHAHRYASKLESSDLLNGQSLAELHRWLVGAGGGSSGWDFRATVLCVFFWSRLQRQVPSRAAARAAKVPLY